MDSITPPTEPQKTQRTQTICLVILSVFAVMYAVYWLRPILVPFVVAIFVVSGVGPILSNLERKLGVNRIVAAGITLIMGTLILTAFSLAIWNSVRELNQNATAYRDRIESLVAKIEAKMPSSRSAPQSPSSELEEQSELGESETEISQSIDAYVTDGITRLIQALAALMSSTIVVLIYVFFLLIGTPSHNSSPAVLEIMREVRSYLRVKTIISAVTGLLFGLALWLFGVPMAFAFGVLAFLLNFVPNVGPMFATLLPVPLIVFAPEQGLVWMISCITVISLIQMISGNLVEPKIMGESSDLHPVTILLALMFWGMMWGVIGMFLATPITSVMKLMLDRSESTRALADLMAGRWREPETEASA